MHKSFLICLLVTLTFKLSAQEEKDNKYGPKPTRNFVKINLFGLALKNYSLQYELAVSKRVSFAIGYRSMSKGSLPMKSQLLSSVGSNDQSTTDQINNLVVGNTAITPEIRFYLGKKGYGRGFYIAPFYRMQKFTVENIEVSYTNSSNTQSKLSISGKLDGNTAGLLLGAQWKLGKHVSLDWQIIGPMYGTSDGSLTGVSSTSLTSQEQTTLRDELTNNLDIPFADKTITVTSNSVKVGLTGPWAGIRTGLCLGISL